MQWIPSSCGLQELCSCLITLVLALWKTLIPFTHGATT